MTGAIKESFKHIDKVWGEEIWLVNRPEYCSKLLVVDEGAICSYHYHPKKTETFYMIEGYAKLTVDGRIYTLAPFARPKTILAGTPHKFEGLTNAVILEVSTHHEDDDVIRLEPSRAAVTEATLVNCKS